MSRIVAVAFNTCREAVRDRVLYNLIVFALLIVGSALLFGQISISIERVVLINMGLTSISIFGIVISIFIGIGLVWKEIERRTLYTVLAHPVRRWEFIFGKYIGLLGTLTLNALLMAVGFFAALLYLSHSFSGPDLYILIALYFILLQFMMMTAIAMLYSTYSSPLLSSIFAFSTFVIGTFSEDLHNFAATSQGPAKWIMTAVAYVVPNFSSLNVVSQVAHGTPVAGALVLHNTVYAVTYSVVLLLCAAAIFENRNFK
jgi:ABC-type transport system involved in multi-copper enzyme maturation permease subunit